MNTEGLIQQFEKFDTNRLDKYKELISSKNNGKIFPPYIPHIGSNYGEYKLMMYGMAQSISEPWPSLINKSNSEKVRQMYDAPTYNDICIAPYEVMLSIAGVYIYAKHQNAIESFDEIHNYIAATNYYKFSFSDDGNDVNPDSDLQSPETYWEENDKLSMSELGLLEPSVVLSFNGRHNNVIKKQGINFIKINDPSWILQGAGGHLKEGDSWYRVIKQVGANKLVESYLEQISGKYAGKKDAIKIYLLKYYSDWTST